MENIKLKGKVGTVCDLLRTSWEEHAAQLVEDDAIIEELEKENIHLRDMLKLNFQGFTLE
jgi:cell shape-determining protein MreC